MPRLHIREVDNTIEKDILTAMIVSPEVMQKVKGFLSADVFKIKYCQTIAKWCIDFYNEHEDVPGQHIEDIFEQNRESLRSADSDLIESFLTDLSERHERNTHINVNFIFDRARKYAKKRVLEQFHNHGIDALRRGDTEEAERAYLQFARGGKNVGAAYSPVTIAEVNESYSLRNENNMFSMPGAVGDLMGQLQRGWLVAYMGPMKRGKTFWLAETSLASTSKKYNTLFVSLEMNRHDTNNRLFRRMLNRPDEGGPIDLPVFDCFHNQDNSCSLRKRVKRNQTVLTEEGDVMKYKPNMRYKPCTKCIGEEAFFPAMWKKTVDMEAFAKGALLKKVKGFRRLYGDCLRVACFPAFSATIDDIEGEIDWLDVVENFKVDTLVMDYADIVNPGRRDLSERGSLDHIWKRLKQLAAEKNILVVTASQTNRQAINRHSIRDVDTAEDIRKMAHVDLTMGLNQTPDDKEVGLMRVNSINHRHRRTPLRAEAWVAQALEIGLPHIYSYLHVP